MNDNDKMIFFRPLDTSDLPMLLEWLHRPHVSEWWDTPTAYADVECDYLPSITTGESTTQAYIALLENEPIGFIQSYIEPIWYLFGMR